MFRKDFEAFTNSKALKQKAVELCGQEFIVELNREGLYAKDEDFWKKVNEKLNIPENYYERLQIEAAEEREQQEKERRERKEAEIARYKAEVERLQAGKKLIDTKEEGGWTIEIFQVPISEIIRGTFFATGTRGGEKLVVTDFQKDFTRAWRSASSAIYNFEREESAKIYNEALDKLIKSIYLLSLYLTGSDEYNELYRYDEEKRYSKESFIGVENWNGFIHGYINELEREGYLKLSTTKKSLRLTKKAVRFARELLLVGKIDFSDHAEIFLRHKEKHDDYVREVDWDDEF